MPPGAVFQGGLNVVEPLAGLFGFFLPADSAAGCLIPLLHEGGAVGVALLYVGGEGCQVGGEGGCFAGGIRRQGLGGPAGHAAIDLRLHRGY